jgi:hypothetical protein
MKTKDLLRSSAALRWRAEQCRNGVPAVLRGDIDSLADSAFAGSNPEDVSLRGKLCVVRRLALLGRPLDALALFDTAVRDCAIPHRPNMRNVLPEDGDTGDGQQADVKATIVSDTNSNDSDDSSPG